MYLQNSKYTFTNFHRHECFTGKYTVRKTHTKLHPGPEFHIFHILASEDIDDVISRFYAAAYFLVVKTIFFQYFTTRK